jgi:fermentation-respiration switch protein FrsA (DUF1100 family)
MITWNGLDSTKEHMYSSGHWDELAARGISALMVDCPGSGEALRLQGLTARVDTEAWVVAWGANHDWGAVQRRRLQREGERPVPHYWDHVLWVRGYHDLDEFIQFAGQVNLDGVVAKITVPFLIAHGEGDRQIPLEYAHRSYDQAVASPKRELRIFTAEEGATEHIGLNHLPHVSAFIADWSPTPSPSSASADADHLPRFQRQTLAARECPGATVIR